MIHHAGLLIHSCIGKKRLNDCSFCPYRKSVFVGLCTNPIIIFLHREPGCPRINLSMESVTDLRALNYSWSKIASQLNVSRSTLYRRLKEAGISTDDYVDISPNELDDVIKSTKLDYP